MFRSTLRLLVIAAISVFLCPSTQATQVIYQTPQQLGASAPLVVRGTVSQVRSFWNADGSKIFTETLVKVDESYKGQVGGQVRLLQLGGVVGNTRITVHGATMWGQGEEVVLFLEPYVSGTYHVAGFSQGKFNIVRDELGKPFIQRPDLKDSNFVSSQGGQPVRSSRVDNVPLDKFIEQALGTKGGSR